VPQQADSDLSWQTSGEGRQKGMAEMLKAEVALGRVYRAKINGKLTRVRLDRESTFGNGWDATNLLTNRKVRIRSAAKLRYEIDPASPVGAARKMVR
jgi:hypothetical protein